MHTTWGVGGGQALAHPAHARPGEWPWSDPQAGSHPGVTGCTTLTSRHPTGCLCDLPTNCQGQLAPPPHLPHPLRDAASAGRSSLKCPVGTPHLVGGKAEAQRRQLTPKLKWQGPDKTTQTLVPHSGPGPGCLSWLPSKCQSSQRLQTSSAHVLASDSPPQA